MSKMTRVDARQHASQAGRGSLSSLESLFRSLINDEVRDIPAPGVGITDGTGTICKWSVHERGDIIVSSCLLDLTGLKSATSDLDIIGEAVTGGVSYLGQITAAINGTILGGLVTCLEAPLSLTDIDMYSATEATGAHEANESTLTATALLTAGAAWTIERVEALTAVPAANEYLYLVNGAADTADDFTAGKFLIELFGYDA